MAPRHPIFQVLALLVLGALLGGTATNAFLGWRIDMALTANRQLTNQLETALAELAKVKENLASERHATVMAVEAHVTVRPGQEPTPYLDPSWQLALEKEVQEFLRPLVGRELKQIDYLLLPQIVNQRTVSVEAVDFRLQVDLVVAGERIIFYVSAFPQ